MKWNAKPFLLLALLAGLSHAPAALALVCNSTGTGLNWANAATWTCGRVPLSVDDVTILAGHTITMNGNPGAALSLVINGTATWGQARTTNVGAGGVTVNAGGNIAGAANGILTSTGGLTINATTTSTTVTVRLQTTAGQTISGTGSLARLQVNATATNAGTLTVGTALTGASTLTNTGTLNIGGTSTITGLTASAVGNTINYSGAAQTIKTPTANTYHHLQFTGSGAKTAAAGLTVNGDLTFSGTASFAAGTSLTHTFLGNWIVNTTAATPFSFTTGSTINFNTPGTPAATSLGGTTTATIAFNVVNVNNTSGFNVNDNISASGNLTIASGVTFTPAAAVVISGAGTLTGNGTVQVTRTAATADFSSQYTITNNTLTNLTVEYNGAAAQTVSALTYGHLKINNASGATLGGTVTVGGTLTLTSGTLAVDANTLNLNGPAIAGTPSNLSTTSSSNLSFGGTSAGISVPGSVTQLNNLTISNSNGIALNSGPTVNGTLSFTSGNLSTAANTLTIASAGSISGAATSQHVVGNLARTFAVAGAFTFAVGDGMNYTPVTVTFATLPTPGSLTVTTPTTAGDHPNTTDVTSSVNASKSVNRYWTLKNSTLSGSYSATLNYISGTPVDLDSGVTVSNFVAARGSSCTGSGITRACPIWSRPSLGGVPSSTQATATGISISSGDPESDFVVGESATARFLREKEFIYNRERY